MHVGEGHLDVCLCMKMFINEHVCNEQILGRAIVDQEEETEKGPAVSGHHPFDCMDLQTAFFLSTKN